MESTVGEQRRSPRIKTDALVDVAATDVLLFHKIVNISLGGILIECPTVEETGTEVDLCINFPDLDETVEARGVVVWSHEEPSRGMAIRFIELTLEQKAVMRRYLGMQDPTPAGGFIIGE